MHVGAKMKDKFLTIRDINGQIEVDTKIGDYHEDSLFIVIDKVEVANEIASRIYDQVDKDFDTEDDCHILYEEIDDYIINDAVNSIYWLVEEKLQEMLK